MRTMNLAHNQTIRSLVVCSALGFSLLACGGGNSAQDRIIQDPPHMPDDLDTITLGAGCFWCVEAVFAELNGVHKVTSGYMGGHVQNPTYKQVTTGTTGHAEVARILFDPKVVSLDQILEVFWLTHDPTTLNRQGADEGTQYRSAVFFANDEQRRIAEGYKAELDRSKAFAGPIVTEITPTGEFFEAENYHQDYFANNPDQGYCRMVIQPKLEKFRKVFADRLKER